MSNSSEITKNIGKHRKVDEIGSEKIKTEHLLFKTIVLIANWANWMQPLASSRGGVQRPALAPPQNDRYQCWEKNSGQKNSILAILEYACRQGAKATPPGDPAQRLETLGWSHSRK